jgi:DNA-binding LacI/PurR family transcriptional regulator
MVVAPKMTGSQAKRKGNRAKSATLSDVARFAGVSCSAAGQVLNGGSGNTRCSAETAERIRETARQLGYRPNHAARQLCGKRSHLYGLLVASAGDPLRSFLVEYLDKAAVKMGCHTIIGNTVADDHGFDYHIEEFARRGVDGVICAVHHWFAGDRAALLACHPNTVFYEDPHVAGAAYVSVDREAAARLAMHHLIEQGRRKIALTVMSLSRSTHQARHRGYLSALAAAALPVDERLIFNAEHYGLVCAYYDDSVNRWKFPAELMDLVVERLVVAGGADAIVAHDDFWAATLIKAMRARGIRVPQDVAVVGYLNHYLADWTDPALTTIDLQHKLAADTMVKMLEKMIRHGSLGSKQRVVSIKPALVVRESA